VVYDISRESVGEDRNRFSGWHRAVSTCEVAGSGARSGMVLPVSHRIPTHRDPRLSASWPLPLFTGVAVSATVWPAPNS
jgi:hypothetical protein